MQVSWHRLVFLLALSGEFFADTAEKTDNFLRFCEQACLMEHESWRKIAWIFQSLSFLLITQAQQRLQDAEEEGMVEVALESPYEVVREDTEPGVNGPRPEESENPVIVNQYPDYTSNVPTSGFKEEYNPGAEGPPPDKESPANQEPPLDYSFLEELKELSERYGENGGRLLGEWYDQWRLLLMKNEEHRIPEWFERIRRDFGPRLVGHKGCHRKAWLYYNDFTRSTMHGPAVGSAVCAEDCVMWVNDLQSSSTFTSALRSLSFLPQKSITYWAIPALLR